MNFLNYLIHIPINFVKYFLIGLKSITITFPLFLINKFKKSKKKIPNTILFLSIISYLLCIFILTRWFVQNERTKNFTNSITNQETLIINETTNEYKDNNNIEDKISNTNEFKTNNYDTIDYINVNLDYYLNKNKETIGWIQIKDTNINYPIVQHKDNEYYLNHDFYNKKTEVGWIYADYRNNFESLDNNTIIYGHNLINKIMFGEISDFLEEEWLNKEKKPYIKVSTIHHNTVWEIFSIYKIEPTTDYLQAKFNSIEHYSTFLTLIKNRSKKNFNIEIQPTDKIITLSTCDHTGLYRVVVHAKLIKIQNK